VGYGVVVGHRVKPEVTGCLLLATRLSKPGALASSPDSATKVGGCLFARSVDASEDSLPSASEAATACHVHRPFASCSICL